VTILVFILFKITVKRFYQNTIYAILDLKIHHILYGESQEIAQV